MGGDSKSLLFSPALQNQFTSLSSADNLSSHFFEKIKVISDKIHSLSSSKLYLLLCPAFLPSLFSQKKCVWRREEDKAQVLPPSLEWSSTFSSLPPSPSYKHAHTSVLLPLSFSVVTAPHVSSLLSLRKILAPSLPWFPSVSCHSLPKAATLLKPLKGPTILWLCLHLHSPASLFKVGTGSRTSPGNLPLRWTLRPYLGLLSQNLHFNKPSQWLSSTLMFRLSEAFDTRLRTPSSPSSQFVFGYPFLISFSSSSFSNNTVTMSPPSGSALSAPLAISEFSGTLNHHKMLMIHTLLSLSSESRLLHPTVFQFCVWSAMLQTQHIPSRTHYLPHSSSPTPCSFWVSYLDFWHHWPSVLSPTLDSLGSSLPLSSLHVQWVSNLVYSTQMHLSNTNALLRSS